MEAEAQCAYLLEHNLVDGVVTDDSDVFLFGGSRVYKNMFNQEKYVECYLLQDLGREMHLDQTKLIQLAYFLGSDYTPGLPGIGYVSAMEILAAFQDDNDDDDGNDEQSLVAPLHRFKQWYDSGTDSTDFERKFVSSRRAHRRFHFNTSSPLSLRIEKEAYTFGYPA
jgi:DNA excision repair protein ERCC-5